MFSTNWVSRSPHHASRRTSTARVHTGAGAGACRGVPTALLLTQPRSPLYVARATLTRRCRYLPDDYVCLAARLEGSERESSLSARAMSCPVLLRHERTRAKNRKKNSILPGIFAECVLRHSFETGRFLDRESRIGKARCFADRENFSFLRTGPTPSPSCASSRITRRRASDEAAAQRDSINEYPSADGRDARAKGIRRAGRPTDRRSRGQYFSGRHRPGSVSRSSPATLVAQPPSRRPLHRYLRPRQYRPPVRPLAAATACYSPRPPRRTTQAGTSTPRRVPGRARWHALLNHFHLCRALCWL